LKDQTLMQDERSVLKKIAISIVCLVILIAIGTFYLYEKTGNLKFALFESMKTVTHIEMGIGGGVSLLFFLLSLLGAILSLYVIITLVSIFFTDRLKKNLAEAKLMKEITSLKDHYIVFGGGSLGASVARALKDKGKQAVVIEADNEKVSELNEAGILAIEGDCFEKTYLEKAKIGLAKVAIVCLNDDGDNLLVTMLAKQMNPRIKVIAEATYDKYVEHLKKVGADEVVVAQEIGGVYMAKMASEY